MQVAKVIYDACSTVTPELEAKYQALKTEINSKKLAYQKLHKAYDQAHIQKEKVLAQSAHADCGHGADHRCDHL